MKKRLISGMIVALIILPIFCLPVYGASSFPFEKYSVEKGNLSCSAHYNYDTDYIDFIIKDGFMLAQTIEYTGLKDDKPLYTQEARLTIDLPDNYYDNITGNYKTNSKIQHVFYTVEADTWYNEYVINSVNYSISHTIDDIEVRVADRNKTCEEAIEAEVEFYKNLKKESSNIADDPVTIRKENDGYSIITHVEQPTVSGLTDGGESDISSDYAVFDCVYNEWKYIRYLTIPELPNVYIKIIYRESDSRTVKVQDGANSDYVPYYEKALARIEGHRSLKLGEKILNVKDLIKIEWRAPITYENTEAQTPAPYKENNSVTTYARDDDKEQSSSIPSLIVVGLASAGVAAGAAKSGKQGTEEEKDDKNYKMYVQKDFGDGIRRGGKPVIVRARIAEVLNGRERDRDDLTALISVSGDNLTVHKAELIGRYAQATVSVPESCEAENATISFIFNGEGGTFTNNIVFRVVDKPNILFIDQPQITNDIYLNVISGDGGVYSTRFFFENATSEPKKIVLNAGEDFEVKYEATENMYTYKAIVYNKTPKKEQQVFVKNDRRIVEIEAEFEDGEIIVGGFHINLLPEGLSFKCFEVKDNFMTVDTQEDENAGDLDHKIRPVRFETVLAYSKKEEGVLKSYVLSGKEYTIKFGEMIGDKEYIDVFKKTFKYKIDTSCSDEGIFAFAPLNTLPMPNDPYEIKIKVEAFHNGNPFKKELPIRLLGEAPTLPSEWDKEMELLKRAITRYGLSNNQHLRYAIRDAKSLSANELCMLRRAIIIEAMNYYTAEGKYFTDLEQYLGKMEFAFACVKWILDQAFSHITNTYFTAQGYPYAEAFITPFKDLVGNFLGELTASAYWGSEIEASWADLGQAALKGTENSLGNMMGDAVAAQNVKKLGGVIAGFMFITWLEKYYFDKDAGGDIYKATIATFGDLANNAAKTAFSAKFGDVIKKSPSLNASLSKFFGNHFAKKFPELLDVSNESKFATESAMKLVEKYATETLGLALSIWQEDAIKTMEKMAKDEFEFDQLYSLPDSKEKDRKIKDYFSRRAKEIREAKPFEMDITVGGSTIRVDLLESAVAIFNFIWENVLNLLVLKPAEQTLSMGIAVADCTEYEKESPVKEAPNIALNELRKMRGLEEL